MQVAVQQATIAWQAAAAAVQAAQEHAAKLAVAINVAVVDCSGLPIAFLRAPGAPLHSIDIATDKAYTAASFGLPTSQWLDALATHSPAVQRGLVLRPRFVMFGGGLPIIVAGQVIGGIGVSGASEEQDEACARAGLQAMGLSA